MKAFILEAAIETVEAFHTCMSDDGIRIPIETCPNEHRVAEIIERHVGPHLKEE